MSYYLGSHHFKVINIKHWNLIYVTLACVGIMYVFAIVLKLFNLTYLTRQSRKKLSTGNRLLHVEIIYSNNMSYDWLKIATRKASIYPILSKHSGSALTCKSWVTVFTAIHFIRWSCHKALFWIMHALCVTLIKIFCFQC